MSTYFGYGVNLSELNLEKFMKNYDFEYYEDMLDKIALRWILNVKIHTFEYEILERSLQWVLHFTFISLWKA